MDVPEVFARFMPLTRGGGMARGEGDTRFLYIPGTRPDRVLLLAHADTVWDAKPGYPAPVRYVDGVYSSQNPELGIGGDDRAGCAILGNFALWAIRSCLPVAKKRAASPATGLPTTIRMCWQN